MALLHAAEKALIYSGRQLLEGEELTVGKDAALNNKLINWCPY